MGIDLHIDKNSQLTAYEQLREQIIFLISTDELPIGAEMPSVRGLARRLGLSLNTVSKVYSSLASGGWLVERPGSHHRVIERREQAGGVFSGRSLDQLIDHTIGLALQNGYSLRQLADRLRSRLLEKPPDHLLLVEPEAGLGEIMRQEIHERVGFAPEICSIARLQHSPSLRIGALVIAPGYIAENLCGGAADRTQTVAVHYSPLKALLDAISGLLEPSMIGLVSVSAAGLKTVAGMVAPLLKSRHTIHLFLMKRDDSNCNQFTLRRFSASEYRPRNILRTAAPMRSAAAVPEMEEVGEAVSVSDLCCMDILMLDSVASAVITHRHSVQYRLLSEESLERIEEAARTVRKRDSTA
jgi:GntR family transcriptional regulator